MGALNRGGHFTQQNSADALRKMLDQVGAIDFKKLDEDMLVRWCIEIGVWPDGMKASLKLDELGLSDDDLKQEEVEARKVSEERKRAARSVPFNGRMIDPEGGVDFGALTEEIRASLPKGEISRSLSFQASLAATEDDDHRPIGSKKSRKKHGSGGLPRSPAEKTEFIGRIGEIVVYSWLKNILKGQDVDAAWKSRNGGYITGRDGDDGLGYDFEVSYDKQTWRIEVKASLNDPQAFELGETEVAAAREAAKGRSGVRYKIAYVSNVSDPKETRIELLPNPMTDEGASCLKMRGEGIRYSFKRL